MMTEEHSKEDLSRAYVQAVSARAGVIVSINQRSHDYGIDGSFHEVSILNGRRIENGNTLDFQLKATTHIDILDNCVCFKIDSNTINLIASRAHRPRATPAILIVHSLPLEINEWLQLSEKELLLRRCCYWCSISALTTNLYSATVRIPRSQLFTPEELNRLLKKISDGALA